MEMDKQIYTEYRLTLTEFEATILAGHLQNPEEHWSPEFKSLAKKIFQVFKFLNSDEHKAGLELPEKEQEWNPF